MDSILNSIKKMLGIAPDYDEFDVDIIMHINSTFSTLNQLGIGPLEGFMVEDVTSTWDEFLLGDSRLNSVKTYTGLKVRLVFDPPATSFGITAMENQIKEHEWRLNAAQETNTPTVDGSIIIDGGDDPTPTDTTTIIDGGQP